MPPKRRRSCSSDESESKTSSCSPPKKTNIEDTNIEDTNIEDTIDIDCSSTENAATAYHLRSREVISPQKLLESLPSVAIYRSDPNVYLEKRIQMDILNMNAVAFHLKSLFSAVSLGGICYIPFPLIEVCVGYVRRTQRSVIQQVLDECAEFIKAGCVLGAMKSAPELAKSINKHVPEKILQTFCEDTKKRAENFRVWFRVKELLPLFVEVDSYIKIDPGFKNRIFAMIRPHRSAFCIQLRDDSIRVFWLTWHMTNILTGSQIIQVTDFCETLLQYLPDLKIIAPALNTASCTKEVVQLCAQQLSERYFVAAPRGKNMKWWCTTVERMLVMLALTRESIQVIDQCLSHEKMAVIKRSLQEQWNKFHLMTGFGEPFAL